jgi:cytidyltransferase-like protein
MIYDKVLTCGTFDLLHIGHILLLDRARAYGDELIVGLSTDKFSKEKKGVEPIYPYLHRLKLGGRQRNGKR